MEVKINREIRQYSESIFFGLSLRQTIFSVLAIGVAILLFFLLKGSFGLETISWICIIGAMPFALLGFITFQGMNAEQLVLEAFKSKVLMKKHIGFIPTNVYYEALKITIKNKEVKYFDKIIKARIGRRKKHPENTQ